MEWSEAEECQPVNDESGIDEVTASVTIGPCHF
jgi:hypothetical protein